MEKVLEILHKESYNLYMGFEKREKAAKEIHEHYMKFVEWKDENSVYLLSEGKFWTTDKIKGKIIWIENLYKLYEYWCNLPENKEE